MVQLITILQERRKTNIMNIVFLMKKSMYPIFILTRLSLRIKFQSKKIKYSLLRLRTVFFVLFSEVDEIIFVIMFLNFF
jgi:hypothetical protein